MLFVANPTESRVGLIITPHIIVCLWWQRAKYFEFAYKRNLSYLKCILSFHHSSLYSASFDGDCRNPFQPCFKINTNSYKYKKHGSK